MIGTYKQIKHDTTSGLYRMLDNFCPAIGRIAWNNPGTIKAGSLSLGIVSEVENANPA